MPSRGKAPWVPVSPADLGSAEVCPPRRQPAHGSALGCSEGLCLCLPCDPLTCFGDRSCLWDCFHPQFGMGSQLGISSHDSGWARKARLPCVSFHHVPPSVSPKAMHGSGSCVWPCMLPVAALGREETLTQLCLADCHGLRTPTDVREPDGLPQPSQLSSRP